MFRVKPVIIRKSVFEPIRPNLAIRRAGYPLLGMHSVSAAGRLLSLGLHQHRRPLDRLMEKGMKHQVKKPIKKTGVQFELEPKTVGQQKSAQKALVDGVMQLAAKKDGITKCPFWAFGDGTWLSIRITSPFPEEDTFLFEPIFPHERSKQEAELIFCFYYFLDHLLTRRCLVKSGELKIEDLQNKPTIVEPKIGRSRHRPALDPVFT